MTTPPYQQQPPPTAQLAFTVHGSVMTASPVTPTVRINGWPAPVKYGLNQLPVYAGPVRIDVECQWLTTFGRATLEFFAQPGQQIPVYYAPPFNVFSKGAIGHQPQKRNGLAAMLAAIGIPVLIVVLLLVLL